MLWRVRDILPVIAPFLGGSGVTLECNPSGVEETLTAYNRINEILMNRHDWKGTEANVCFTAHRGCITLPEEFEAIKALRVDGRATRILPDGFEYLEAGPGSITFDTPLEVLQFLGSTFPTYRDLARPMLVGCFSTHQEAEGSMLRIYGRDSTGQEIRTGVTPGLTIPIAKGDAETRPYMTAIPLGSISAISKPLTKGRVEVFAFDEIANVIYWLSRLQPTSTTPALTRYMLSGYSCDEDVTVRAKVSLRYVELFSPDDISLIQHREAYRLMAQAINAFDDGQGDVGSQYRNRAISMLKEQVAKQMTGQRHAINVTSTRAPLHRGRRYTIR